MKNKRVIIVGGGISALSLGWFLKKRHGRNIEICILEASERAGGQILSLRQEGFLFEQGPHSWRSGRQTSALERLLEDLSLQADVIEAAASARHRYLYFDKKLQRLPTGALGWLCSRFGPMLCKALWRDFTAPKGSGADEALLDFVNRRLGKEVAQQLFDPFVSGIYAGNLQTLSLAATFPRLQQWEQHFGSLLRGMLAAPKNDANSKPAIYSFKQGMGTLIDRLAMALKSELRLHARVEKFDYSHEGVSVRLSSGEVIQGGHLFFAVPATVLKDLVAESAPQLALDLQKIPSAPIAVANLGYRKNLLRQQGFGYLIPSREKEKILGVIWDSATFPAQAQEAAETRLTVMLGGAKWDDFHCWNKDDFLLAALEGVKRHMHIEHLPDLCAVRVIPEGIPQYHVGHNACVKRIEQQLQQLSNRIDFLGNSFYGVSVGECIQQGETSSLKELHF